MQAALEGRRQAAPDSERWREEAEAAQAQLDELATLYGQKEITVKEWLAARKPIERRLSRAQAAREDDSAHRPLRLRQ